MVRVITTLFGCPSELGPFLRRKAEKRKENERVYVVHTYHEYVRTYVHLFSENSLNPSNSLIKLTEG